MGRMGKGNDGLIFYVGFFLPFSPHRFSLWCHVQSCGYVFQPAIIIFFLLNLYVNDSSPIRACLYATFVASHLRMYGSAYPLMGWVDVSIRRRKQAKIRFQFINNEALEYTTSIDFQLLY
ncbi:hypothetical protein GGR51DRAFT_518368 [Nemania sp. FL0031]|nr:hypothetical protein GGR51DRAFT_518368 [Nemania sp. FL0031]